MRPIFGVFVIIGVLCAGISMSAPLAAHNGILHSPALSEVTKKQIHKTAVAIEKYKDFRIAKQEGWKKFGGDEPLMGEHWYPPKDRGWPDYQGSEAEIDFTRPSNLMYTEIDGRKTLTGVAFLVRLGENEPLPEGFAGNADRWHIHDFAKAISAATQDRPFLRRMVNRWLEKNYFSKRDNRTRIAMAHAWVTLPNPDGIFADRNRTIPYLKLGLPIYWSEGANIGSARGLNLATDGGCSAQTKGRLWIANASRKTKRRINAACKRSAEKVSAVLNSRNKALINKVSEEAWLEFEAMWNNMLSPTQHSRIASMNEHGESGHHNQPTAHGDH